MQKELPTHYGEWKHKDPALVRDMVETFPFAMIMVNDEKSPAVAQAPLTFREGPAAAGAVEFHLATANPIYPLMVDGIDITISVQGPGAQVSPRWFTSSFKGDKPDRSRTAPTYNYLSLIIKGQLKLMDGAALQKQISDLVAVHERSDGWQMTELAPDLWQEWQALIQLYRIEVSQFDLTAKLSYGEVAEDRPGIVSGLRERSTLGDEAVARLLEDYDGTPESLQARIRSLQVALRGQSNREAELGGVRGH